MSELPGNRCQIAVILAVVLAICLTTSPVAASWLARSIGSAGIVYSVHKNLGESISGLGEMLDAYLQGNIERVRSISEEFEQLPGKIVRDTFPVLAVGLRAVDAAGVAGERLRQGLNSAELKIERFVEGAIDEAGGVVADARAALAIDSDERRLYEHESGILDDTPLPTPAILFNVDVPDDDQHLPSEGVEPEQGSWSDGIGSTEVDLRPAQGWVGLNQTARDTDTREEAVFGNQAGVEQATGSGITVEAWDDDGWSAPGSETEWSEAGCDSDASVWTEGASESGHGVDQWGGNWCDELALGGTPLEGSESYEATLVGLDEDAASIGNNYEAALAALEREGEEAVQVIHEEVKAAVEHSQVETPATPEAGTERHVAGVPVCDGAKLDACMLSFINEHRPPWATRYSSTQDFFNTDMSGYSSSRAVYEGVLNILSAYECARKNSCVEESHKKAADCTIRHMREIMRIMKESRYGIPQITSGASQRLRDEYTKHVEASNRCGELIE